MGNLTDTEKNWKYNETVPSDFVIRQGVLEKYTGQSEEVIIPEGVREIGEGVFAHRGNISRVVIPEGVTKIGDKAFRFCLMLTQITVPDTVTFIGAEAFRRCENLTEFSVPSGELQLGDGAFRDCRGLVDETGFVIIKDTLFGYYGESIELVIPPEIRRIDPGAYTTFQQLTAVVLPEGLKTIPGELFRWCEDLTSINIPESVETIGEQAFRHCRQLADENGFVIRRGRLFGYFGKGGHVVVPEEVTTIETAAFYGNRRVERLQLPNGLRIIGEGAFGHCIQLESVSLPEGLEEIGASAFMGCEALQELRLPPGVTVVRSETFAACTQLQQLQLPNTLETIEDFAFSRCLALTEVTLPESVTTLGRGVFRNCNHLETLVYPSAITIPDNEMLRYLTGLRVLIAPGIGITTFQGQGNRLAAATGYLQAGDRYKNPEIAKGYQSFINRYKLLLLPKLLERDAVQELTKMLDMVTVRAKTFEEDYLAPAQAVDATGCVAALMEWRNRNLPIRDGADFLVDELMKDDYDPEELRKLWGFKKLPDGTMCITGYKGSDTVLDIPPRVGKRPVSTIGGQLLKRQQKSGEGAVKQIRIPEGVTTIEAAAFCMCDALESVTVPASVTRIGERAFTGCPGLADGGGFVTFGGILFGYYGGAIGTAVPEGIRVIEKEAFYECESLQVLQLPASLEQIESYAFYGCRNLEAISIPGGVRRIGEYAFSWCEKLHTVTLCEGVTRIDTAAFAECRGLRTIHIPASVTYIGMWAFNNCDIMTIHAPKNSQATTYAQTHGVPLKVK